MHVALMILSKADMAKFQKLKVRGAARRSTAQRTVKGKALACTTVPSEELANNLLEHGSDTFLEGSDSIPMTATVDKSLLKNFQNPAASDFSFSDSEHHNL